MKSLFVKYGLMFDPLNIDETILLLFVMNCAMTFYIAILLSITHAFSKDFKISVFVMSVSFNLIFLEVCIVYFIQ